MRIRVYESADLLARALARHLARAVAARPTIVLGLPTGRTPVPLYRELVRLYHAGRVDFSRVKTFNLDEFLGIGSGDSRSYCAFMRRHLFNHVNVTPRRIQVLDGLASDPAHECDRYERAIERAGGIDLQLLGLGTNGHIGFNEPDRVLIARTHRTHLTRATRIANAASFGHRLRSVPQEGLSMGMGTILRARRIVLIATGRQKARSVQRMIEGGVTTKLPASFLQLHRSTEVWLDGAAASRLSTRL